LTKYCVFVFFVICHFSFFHGVCNNSMFVFLFVYICCLFIYIYIYIGGSAGRAEPFHWGPSRC
jgi:hypothetical protein